MSRNIVKRCNCLLRVFLNDMYFLEISFKVPFISSFVRKKRCIVMHCDYVKGIFLSILKHISYAILSRTSQAQSRPAMDYTTCDNLKYDFFIIILLWPFVFHTGSVIVGDYF